MGRVVNFEDFICLPDPLQSAKSKTMQMLMGNPSPNQGNCDSSPFFALPVVSSTAPTLRLDAFLPHSDKHLEPFNGKTSGSESGHPYHRTSWARIGGCRQRGGFGRTGREPA